MADSKISALPASTVPLAGTEVLPIVQGGATKQVSVQNVLSSVQPTGTANAVAFLDASKVLSSGSALTFDGTNLNVVNGFIRGKTSFKNKNNSANISYYEFEPETTTAAKSYIGGDGRLGGYIKFYTNDAEQVNINSSGNLLMANGNLVPSTAAKGVNFTANTPAAGMTSQLLNWYEQGTFTPVAQGSSTAGTATYSIQAGQYTRIGNRVLFNLRIAYTGGTGTGNMRVGGLPFTSNSAMTFAVVSIYAENLAGTALYVFAGLIQPNTTYISIDQVPVGGGGALGLAYDGAADISLSGHYLV